jgi:tRNA pseudouridine38-40 synthase
MPTFQITLAYDGTDFVGWQRQAAGRSIQGLLEDALRELDGRDVTVHGAGRTDAGVHALGQVASFTLDRAIGADVLVRAINARLPGAIRVLRAVEAASDFHARFRARRKAYRYRVWNADIADPFERAYAWHIAGALDLEAMAAAAQPLVGRHDFAAFQSAGTAVKTTEREISSLSVAAESIGPFASLRGAAGEVARGMPLESRLILFDVCGDGFLRHMVRTIVGSLVEVGRGRRDAAWVAQVLASGDRGRAGPTAPASGLFLMAVQYGGGSLADEP